MIPTACKAAPLGGILIFLCILHCFAYFVDQAAATDVCGAMLRRPLARWLAALTDSGGSTRSSGRPGHQSDELQPSNDTSTKSFIRWAIGQFLMAVIITLQVVDRVGGIYTQCAAGSLCSSNP